MHCSIQCIFFKPSSPLSLCKQRPINICFVSTPSAFTFSLECQWANPWERLSNAMRHYHQSLTKANDVIVSKMMMTTRIVMRKVNPELTHVKMLTRRKLPLTLHIGAKILNWSKNSHFGRLTFHKIHNFKVLFLTKFTFSKSRFWQNHNL